MKKIFIEREGDAPRDHPILLVIHQKERIRDLSFWEFYRVVECAVLGKHLPEWTEACICDLIPDEYGDPHSFEAGSSGMQLHRSPGRPRSSSVLDDVVLDKRKFRHHLQVRGPCPEKVNRMTSSRGWGNPSTDNLMKHSTSKRSFSVLFTAECSILIRE